MANKAIDRAFLVKALENYNGQLDTAVIGADKDDITAAGGIATLEVIEEATGDQLTTIVPAINELDRKQGDDELTVVDTVAGDTDPKETISEAINVLDAEIGDVATLTVVDAANGPQLEVVGAINSLDQKQGDAVIDVLFPDGTPTDNLSDAVNALEDKLGDLSDLKTDDKTTIINAINEHEEMIGVRAGAWSLTTTDQTIAGAIDELDAKQGDEVLTTTAQTLSGAVNELDLKQGDAVLTTTAQDLSAAVNELDAKQGDDVLTVIDTKASKTVAETNLSSAVNVLDKELGENKDFSTDIDDKTTVVAAINSVFKQGQVKITEDTTNTELLKTYIFTQDFEADGTTPHEIGRIELAKELVVTSGECIIATGTEVREDGSSFGLEADKSYLKLTIANQVDPVYIDTRDLVNDYTAEEDAVQIQLAISADREISATVVPLSITHTEVDTPINNELAFTGFDHTLGTGVPAYYQAATAADEGAMKITTSNAPQAGEIPLSVVLAANAIANKSMEFAEGDYVVYIDAVPAGVPQLTTEAQTLREAVNELDEKQGDDILTVVDTLAGETAAKTDLSAAVNVLDKEIGDAATITVIDTVAGEIAEKENVVDAINVLDSDLGDVNTLTVKDVDNNPQLEAVAAINELDRKQGDAVLTVKGVDGNTIEDLSNAVNELDRKQGDDVLTVVDTMANETEAKEDLSAAINVLDKELGEYKDLEVLHTDATKATDVVDALNTLDTKQGDAVLTVVDTVNGETVAKIDLSAAVNVLDAEMGDINTLTVAKADGTILKVVADAINQLDLVQGDDVIIVKDAAGTTMTTLTASVNALEDRLPVTLEEVAEEDLNPGIKAAYKLSQGTTTPVELGLIEIPYSNYEGEATDTITVTVDNTDDHRVITADVNDGSIGKQQLDTEVNDILDYVGDKTIKLSDKETLTEAVNDNIVALTTKMSYKDTISYLDYQTLYKTTAAKNDVYVISQDFTLDGNQYNAGSWALCTDVNDAGDRTWRIINNGGAGTVIKAITNENEIAEVKDPDTGEVSITDIIGEANINDPKGSMYMVATEGYIKFAPHHGIYMKTDEAGGTKIVEVFDFGVEGGNMSYVGSTGANITVTITALGTTGTIGASIVPGSLSKGLMDSEINAIFALTGYPTPLTTEATTLVAAANEINSRVGKLVDLDLGQTTDFASIVEAINFLGFDGMMWKGTIATTAATNSFASINPIKRGWVYNITGETCTVNGLSLTAGDWIICSAPPATVGGEPTFIKLGSVGGSGFDDAGPYTIFR